jgi:uncharacterized protein YqjF (DUF2071 family)
VRQHDFDATILVDTEHRPWPMPARPWVMTQTWHHLLFAHWAVDPHALAAKVPPAIHLDLFDNTAWLGIVPFYMTNVAPRGVPAMPWISAFAELNVRTYVSVGGKPGVYFFSLDAARAVAVAAARTLLNLPYFVADMRVERRGATIVYSSERKRGDARFAASYGPAGSAGYARRGTLDHFLTERYCLYTVDRAGDVLRLNIHHPPWALQPAAAAFDVNTMTAPIGIAVPSATPLLHYCRRQDMVAWMPEPAQERSVQRLHGPAA